MSLLPAISVVASWWFLIVWFLFRGYVAVALLAVFDHHVAFITE